MNNVTTYEIANQFLTKFKEYEDNNIVSVSMFTDDQYRVIMLACKTHPREMCTFFTETCAIICETLENTPDTDMRYIIKACNVFNSIAISITLGVIAVLANNTNDTPKAPTPVKYTTDHDTLFGNLDFNLPDWNSLIE